MFAQYVMKQNLHDAIMNVLLWLLVSHCSLIMSCKACLEAYVSLTLMPILCICAHVKCKNEFIGMQGQETDRSLQLSCGEHSDYGKHSHACLYKLQNIHHLTSSRAASCLMSLVTACYSSKQEPQLWMSLQVS